MNNSTQAEGVIVIDAGHGGKDPGTIGINGSYEKDINLQISKKIAKKLKRKGYQVISTRDKDEYIKNIERVRLANSKMGDIFISIHCNSVENNSSVSGAQVLYRTNNSEMAQIMIDSIITETGAEDKGIVERRDLIVLNQTNMPAMIIECGFLSNEREEALLLTDKYQNKLVDSIIEGLEAHLI